MPMKDIMPMKVVGSYTFLSSLGIHHTLRKRLRVSAYCWGIPAGDIQVLGEELFQTILGGLKKKREILYS